MAVSATPPAKQFTAFSLAACGAPQIRPAGRLPVLDEAGGTRSGPIAAVAARIDFVHGIIPSVRIAVGVPRVDESDEGVLLGPAAVPMVRQVLALADLVEACGVFVLAGELPWVSRRCGGYAVATPVIVGVVDRDRAGGVGHRGDRSRVRVEQVVEGPARCAFGDQLAVVVADVVGRCA